MTDSPAAVTRHPARSLAAALAAAAVLLSAPGAAGADDWPALRKGMWEIERTIDAGGGKVRAVKTNRCMNPTEDMKAQNARLAKAGCTFSPLARRGQDYVFASKCTIQGVSAQATTTITVDSDSAYRLVVEGVTAGEKTRETMHARRTGECR